MRGHIQRRGNGWQVTVDLGRDPLSGKRRRRSRTYRTEGEAEDGLTDLLAEARPRRPAPKSMTVGELLERWLDHIAADRAPDTMRGYRSKVRLYLQPALGDLTLRQLSADRIDALYRALRKKGLAPATVRQTAACLSGACKLAVRYKWLRENPCGDAEPPPLGKRDRSAPALADVARALAECSADTRDAALLGVATGARRGELCGLRWSDIDGNRITFRRSIAGDLSVVDTHRKSEVRHVVVDDATVKLLTARKAKAAADALESRKSLTDGYVLSEVPGQAIPLNPERITGRWRDACKRAKVRVRFHDLRHLSVTTLLAAGVSARNVAARHGHGEAVMLSTYAHAVAAVDEQAAEIMGAVTSRLAESKPRPQRRSR